MAPSGVVLAHLESSLDSGLLERMPGKLPGELVLLCAVGEGSVKLGSISLTLLFLDLVVMPCFFCEVPLDMFALLG